MKTFRSELENLESSNLYPFHMPGHKRFVINEKLANPYLRDITEIDGFDNLHAASGFIKEEEEYAAKVFGADQSFYLINGSSCGVLASIMAVSSKSNQKLLIARNGHKSVYHAIGLSGKKVDYIYPQCEKRFGFSQAVSPKEIEEKLRQQDYAAIYITSPTYEGIVSDIKTICDVAHEKKIPVIVDEAHGAYMGIFEKDGYIPISATKLGADLVIQSMHKTLPSMTQTAILHVKGKLIDIGKLKYYLSVFQSSSPSYILMESISDAIHYCEDHKQELLDHYIGNLKDIYEKASYFQNIELYQKDNNDGVFEKDPGKLVICIKNHVPFSGKQLADMLRKDFKLEMEMAEQKYVIAMTSVMDSKEGFERLIAALTSIDSYLDSIKMQNFETEIIEGHACSFGKDLQLESILSLKDAMNQNKKLISLDESVGKISADFIYLYPPGVPLVVPGEKITKEIVCYIRDKKRAGLTVFRMSDVQNELLNCII